MALEQIFQSRLQKETPKLKKLNNVVPTGTGTTANVNGGPKNLLVHKTFNKNKSVGGALSLNESCMCCNKKISKSFHCSACKSSCLKLCQKNNYKEHKILCSSVQGIEEIEREKRYRNFNFSYETTKNSEQKLKLAKLVGEKNP